MRNNKFISVVSLLLLLALGGMIAIEVIALTSAKTNTEKIKNATPFSEQLLSSFEEADEDVDFTTLQLPEAPHFIIGLDYNCLLPLVVFLFFVLLRLKLRSDSSRHLKLRVLRI